uniref:Uncharacterized protein n=1 Tax=Pongo abelii TaxID=9601 RepID=A0A8I5YUB1_PONAB
MAESLPKIRKFILERNATNVKNVTEPLTRAHILLDTREFILESHPTNVKNVAKPLTGSQTLLSIREFILERNPRNVKNVVKYVFRQKSSAVAEPSWRTCARAMQKGNVGLELSCRVPTEAANWNCEKATILQTPKCQIHYELALCTWKSRRHSIPIHEGAA